MRGWKQNSYLVICIREYLNIKLFLTDVTIQRIFDYFQGFISKSPKIEVLNYGLYLFS